MCGAGDCVLFTEKNGYEIYRCASCNLLFVHPLQDAPTAIYDRNYFEGASNGFGYVNYDEDKEPMRPVFQRYLDIIESNLSGEKGKLLDVGAATGYFVALASDRGFSSQGVDISEHAAAIATAKGRSVRAGTIDNISGTFDCITMLDLIEHVPDPRAVIRRASRLLRPGGILVVNAPDAGSFVARLLGRSWHLISPPEHLHYFNKKNLKRLLEEEEFKIVQSMTIGKSFTFKYIFKTLGRSTHMVFFEKISTFFSRPSLAKISFPVNLRDNMFIVARKNP
jgi:2-polyprenyl-3-methyl-5-hydroxy-6-metoxy-1,4-benzoquinol methylase